MGKYKLITNQTYTGRWKVLVGSISIHRAIKYKLVPNLSTVWESTIVGYQPTHIQCVYGNQIAPNLSWASVSTRRFLTYPACGKGPVGF
jgi:hypothetical protein